MFQSLAKFRCVGCTLVFVCTVLLCTSTAYALTLSAGEEQTFYYDFSLDDVNPPYDDYSIIWPDGDVIQALSGDGAPAVAQLSIYYYDDLSDREGSLWHKTTAYAASPPVVFPVGFDLDNWNNFPIFTPSTSEIQYVTIVVDYGVWDIIHLPSISMSSDTLETSLIGPSGTISPVPEPATMLLLGTGLVGLVGFRRKFKV